MKAVCVFLLMSFLVAGAFGWTLYSEKQDALQAVNDKFTQASVKKNELLQTISEGKNIKEEYETNEKSAAEKRVEISKGQFNDAKIKAARTAIAKGKPVSALECIVKVSNEADDSISEVYRNFVKILTNFKENRLQALKLYEDETKLIFDGLEGLKTESSNAIEKAETGFQNLKNDFVKKAETAEKYFTDIKTRVIDFNIQGQYHNLGKQNESKNKEVTDALVRKVQKCVS